MRSAMKQLLAVTAALIAVAAAPAPLTGNWAGDRMSFVATADSTIVQSDCSFGKIDGAITPDAAGGFTASGYFNDHTPGPQLAEIAPADRPAQFTGKLHGDTLQLTMMAKGQPARHFTLVRDKRIKFVRCL